MTYEIYVDKLNSQLNAHKQVDFMKMKKIH
jgi:hypothetical protein